MPMLRAQTDSPELSDLDLAHPLLALDTLDQSFLREVFRPAQRVEKTDLSSLPEVRAVDGG